MLNLKLYVQAENETITLHFGVLMFKKKLYPRELEKEGEKAFQDAEEEAKEVQKKSTVNPSEKEKKKPIPSKKQAYRAVPEKKETVSAKSPKENDLREKVFLVLDIIRSLIPPVKFLLRGIRIERLRLRVVVGGEEPDETAVRFGHWNAAVYGGLAAVRNLVKVRCEKVAIAVDFTAEETEVQAFGILKIRVWVVITAAVRMIYRILVNTLKRMREENRPPEPAGVRNRAKA